jgi:hypothetical protein
MENTIRILTLTNKIKKRVVPLKKGGRRGLFL